jgi:hypothetical protein
VVVAVGMRRATAWLADSALRTPCGIRCDADGRTVVPGVLRLVTARWQWTARAMDTRLPSIRTSLAVTGCVSRARSSAYRRQRRGFHTPGLTNMDSSCSSWGAHILRIEESTPWPCFVARYLRKGRLLGLFALGVGAAIGQARRELQRSIPDNPRGGTHAVQLSGDICGVSPRPSVYHSFSYPKIVEVSRHGARSPVRARSRGSRLTQLRL